MNLHYNIGGIYDCESTFQSIKKNGSWHSIIAKCYRNLFYIFALVISAIIKFLWIFSV